jgi:hypothetical protein
MNVIILKLLWMSVILPNGIGNHSSQVIHEILWLHRSNSSIRRRTVTVKKVIVSPSPAGMSLTKLSPWAETIKLFPPRESLVSGIPAGDGKNNKLFLQCSVNFLDWRQHSSA